MVEDARKRWGVDSPLYKSKVDGEFSGSQREDAHPGELDHCGAGAPPGAGGLGVFRRRYGRFGSRRSIMVSRRGDHIWMLQDWEHTATTESTGIVVAAARELRPIEITVDGVGVGGGVVDLLAEQVFPSTTCRLAPLRWIQAALPTRGRSGTNSLGSGLRAARSISIRTMMSWFSQLAALGFRLAGS
jgi:hypothetical protein